MVLPLGRAQAGLLQHGGHLRKSIEQLEQQYRQAMLKDDVDTMGRMLADDYLGIEPNGIIQTKAETLYAWKNHLIEMKALYLSDLHVRIYGNTAVVTSRAYVVGRGPDGLRNGEYRYTRVYHRESSGAWQIVSFEANRILRRHHRGA
ncbi:MAG: nuclear transport factor 2 family protein [Acidobacteriaceae bacterium]